ncbi:MAG TPA: peptide-methionine (S)-S-oxide reductase MsrA [Frankiaceae bacterium]|jgi:peptide-methionine (S)-S-oxide reductase|nr:peptide-methionine (S)-S-oxide reductase MsrA [Frankiaceae bacterium]
MPEVITLGAGCFWCLDAAARRTTGILSSRVGYAGGTGRPPSYYELHDMRFADSGWIEAVEIEFDRECITFEDVLDLFFAMHDPTTPNQDGANFGPAYHSTIFYRSEQQREASESVVRRLAANLNTRVVTSIIPYSSFHEAEPEHQDYYAANPRAGYCSMIIRPKLRKLGLDN